MNREVTFTMKDLIRQGVLSKLVAGESNVAEAAATAQQSAAKGLSSESQSTPTGWRPLEQVIGRG